MNSKDCAVDSLSGELQWVTWSHGAVGGPTP